MRLPHWLRASRPQRTPEPGQVTLTLTLDMSRFAAGMERVLENERDRRFHREIRRERQGALAHLRAEVTRVRNELGLTEETP